jgi:hypothetical protein
LERTVTGAAVPAGPELAGPAEAPFSRRAALLLVLTAAASLATAFLLLVFRSDSTDEISVGADSFSVSALGHHTLTELLRGSGRPVVISRFDSVQRAGRSLLVCAEPRPEDLDELRRILADADLALVVLPKRTGAADDEARHWIGEQTLLDLDAPRRFARALADGSDVVRTASTSRWRCDAAVGDLPEPTIADAQLLKGRGFRPLVRCAEGALLVEVMGASGRLFVLSDPDALANHGIDDGDNAAFAIGMLDALRDRRGIVVDETLHGFELAPSVWEQLGRFPLVLLLAHLLLLLAVVAWAAVDRFGPLERAPPAVRNSKTLLLETIAGLLARGDHAKAALRRYARDRAMAAAARVGGAVRDEAAAWARLRAHAAAQRRADRLDRLVADLRAATAAKSLGQAGAADLARRIHSECEEIVHAGR